MKVLGIWGQLGWDLAGFGVLVILAVVAGFAVNPLREKPLPSVYHSKAARLEQTVQTIAKSSRGEDESTPASAPKSGAPIISLDEFQRCVKRSDGVILDARPEVFFRLGHVPGALSLPRNDFEAAYARLRSQLEKVKGQPLVVYCSDADCEDSRMVADALLKLDYRRVSLFKGGWADWTSAHLPEEKSQ